MGTGIGLVAMVTLNGDPEGRVHKGLFALLVPQRTSSPGFCCREHAPGQPGTAEGRTAVSTL